MKKIHDEKLAIVDEAQEFAENSEFPPESYLYEDVYYHNEAEEGGAVR